MIKYTILLDFLYEIFSWNIPVFLVFFWRSDDVTFGKRNKPNKNLTKDKCLERIIFEKCKQNESKEVNKTKSKKEKL